MTLTAVIVDDEPLARDLLEAILSEIEDVKLLAVCKNGKEAIHAVMKHTPDILFLDIEMPEITGFDVINALQVDVLPKVVFTTAFSEYAIKAFKVNALNYILKPIHEDAVMESVARAKEARSRNDKSTLLNALGKASQTQDETQPKTKALVLAESRKISMTHQADIVWLEAAGDYVCVHLGGETKIIRQTLKAFMGELDPQLFQRIHRSTIVNVTHISELIAAKKGEATLLMRDGQRLKVSRSYGAALRSRLKTT